MDKEKCVIIPPYKSPGLSSDVIIFHPGSRHLYFGCAADDAPQKIVHMIARRRKSSHVHQDTLLPVSLKRLNEPAPPEVESARLQLSLTWQSALKSRVNNDRTTLTDQAVVSLTNKNFKREHISQKETSVPQVPPKEFENLEFVIGDDVLNIRSDEEYNIFCPWRRGQLNLHRDIGGSISSIMTDLEDIWRWCIINRLRISSDELKNCSAILVIPVMFDRDHICACFGCGVACATVVDVGDQKVSISCVEDAISYPKSRLELKYGGGDLTISLWNQLQLISFPISVNLSDKWDFEYLRKIKERFCHLDVESQHHSIGQLETLVWDKPGELVCEYKVCFGNEVMIIPLAYFNPDLLRCSIGRKAVISYCPQPPVSDDPFDKTYLSETSKKPNTSGTKEINDEEDDPSPPFPIEGCSKLSLELPLGIDQAIVQSVESIDVSTDLKERLFSCIVLVGGGSKINGFPDWIVKRLETVIPEKFKSAEFEQPRVVSSYKNGDPAITAWKGAAILSSLETTKELWVTQKEWKKFGSKILREKSLFQF